VLQDVSFRVPAGQVVAVVGENGSGKTTLLKLLARLYDPTSGRITLDGTDIRDMEPESLRQCLSVLFQDFNRYQLSARENVWFGNTRRAGNNGEIEAAARDAGAHAAIRALPQGYETVLGRWLQEGQEISVGQWQKVALARAFFRDAPIVALDEPTSALDPTAEFELIGRIGELLSDRTALVISHRLAVARAAHRIVVLHEGQLVESGGHEELMRFDGMYAAMFRAQACRYA
jgi:ATP-binding cassette subfamily B protein